MKLVPNPTLTVTVTFDGLGAYHRHEAKAKIVECQTNSLWKYASSYRRIATLIKQMVYYISTVAGHVSKENLSAMKMCSGDRFTYRDSALPRTRCAPCKTKNQKELFGPAYYKK